jgi:hypothetical protein
MHTFIDLGELILVAQEPQCSPGLGKRRASLAAHAIDAPA